MLLLSQLLLFLVLVLKLLLHAVSVLGVVVAPVAAPVVGVVVAPAAVSICYMLLCCNY